MCFENIKNNPISKEEEVSLPDLQGYLNWNKTRIFQIKILG